jgi:hypothetical protein
MEVRSEFDTGFTVALGAGEAGKVYRQQQMCDATAVLYGRHKPLLTVYLHFFFLAFFGSRFLAIFSDAFGFIVRFSTSHRITSTHIEAQEFASDRLRSANLLGR